MMLIQSHAPRYGTLHNYEFYRTRASEDRDVAQMAVNENLASVARIILLFKCIIHSVRLFRFSRHRHLLCSLRLPLSQH
jgi:hypothetical protein